MKKFAKILILTLTFGFIFSGTSAFAAENLVTPLTKEEISNMPEDVMPDDVKKVMEKNAEKLENIKKGEVTPFYTTAYKGAETSDTAYSETLGNSAMNTVYARIDDFSFWSGYSYYKFSGWGYTGYSGTATPSSVTSTASVKAYGVIPQISFNGSNWSLLSATRQIGSDSNLPGNKYARANYSNVKITAFTGVNAIFSNAAYIKLPSGANDSWTEDTYVWF
ncbi:hypothetical protein MKZ20_21505 [Psychrobacillus sp. FSL K6-2684]|uniref:hypothetical protein n=1 Tax=unclassified Psychrobacillus TaxID=2636677 RepID=UPI0030FAA434